MDGYLTSAAIVASIMLASAEAGTVLQVDDDNCPGPGSGTAGDPYCSIQAAIIAAVDGDEIIVAPGSYFETIDFLGRAIAVRNSGGPLITVIDGSFGGSVVTCAAGEGPATVLQGFTITGGAGTLDQGFTYGGGLFASGSSPTVITCWFLDNIADGGGGMFIELSDASVIDCVFAGNSGSAGGGMFSAGGRSMMLDCEFTGNDALLAGGLFLGAEAPVVASCTFRDNTSNLAGGGAAVAGMADAVFVNCLFSGNLSSAGGMSIAHPPLAIVNCTFSRNTGGSGGGLRASNGGSLWNCIFWENVALGKSGTAQIDDVDGTVVVNFSDVEGGWSGAGSSNIDADPLFVDPDNGDYRLSPGSPCIDAGDNTAVPQGFETDLDGNPRFLDVPETPDTGSGAAPIVDMGAYESLGGGCLALTTQEVDCHPDGTTFTLSIAGLSACTGGTVMAAFTASGGDVGEDLCFTVMVNQEQGGFCCSTQVCAPVPDCSDATADLDGDGAVGVLDLILLLAQFGTCEGSCWADMDHDGAVGVMDLLILLANWD